MFNKFKILICFMLGGLIFSQPILMSKSQASKNTFDIDFGHSERKRDPQQVINDAKEWKLRKDNGEKFLGMTLKSFALQIGIFTLLEIFYKIFGFSNILYYSSSFINSFLFMAISIKLIMTKTNLSYLYKWSTAFFLKGILLYCFSELIDYSSSKIVGYFFDKKYLTTDTFLQFGIGLIQFNKITKLLCTENKPPFKILSSKYDEIMQSINDIEYKEASTYELIKFRYYVLFVILYSYGIALDETESTNEISTFKLFKIDFDNNYILKKSGSLLLKEYLISKNSILID